MDELVGLVELAPQHGAPAQQVAGRDIGHVAEGRLGTHDGVEVAAIGDVHGQGTEARAVHFEAPRMQERGHVGDPHLFDELALLPVFGDHQPGRGVEPQGAGGLGRDEAVLDGHRHGPDRAVSAHRQAARGLDEQDGDVAILRASADTGSSPTSCRGRAARTSAPVRIQSYSARKCARLSSMVAPSSWGPPPATRRTGLPQVWPSMHRKVWRDMQVLAKNFPSPIAGEGGRRAEAAQKDRMRIDQQRGPHRPRSADLLRAQETPKSPLRRPWPGLGDGSGSRARCSRRVCAARRLAACGACAHARWNGSQELRRA